MKPDMEFPCPAFLFSGGIQEIRANIFVMICLHDATIKYDLEFKEIVVRC